MENFDPNKLQDRPVDTTVIGGENIPEQIANYEKLNQDIEKGIKNANSPDADF